MWLPIMVRTPGKEDGVRFWALSQLLLSTPSSPSV